jgi:hypothetical protein
MSKFVNPTKVITGICTFSYLNCWEPKAIEGGKPKFSVSLVIPKSDTKTVERIRAAIQAAYEEGASKLKGNGKSVPALSAIRTPLRDGDKDRPDDEVYKGCWFINANSDSAPGIVDADRQPILTRSEMYSGVKGRASINLYSLQRQRQPRHRLRTEQPAEDRRWHSARRQVPRRGRLRHRGRRGLPGLKTKKRAAGTLS